VEVQRNEAQLSDSDSGADTQSKSQLHEKIT
jgi:hypothetical protein